MYSKLRYVLVFILFMGFCEVYGQQSETFKSVQDSKEENLQSVQEKGEELQNKVFTKIDSLANKSANLLQITTDSLNNLTEAIPPWRKSVTCVKQWKAGFLTRTMKQRAIDEHKV